MLNVFLYLVFWPLLLSYNKWWSKLIITGNRCLTLGKKTPKYMNPVAVGSEGLLSVSKTQPPAEAPNPVLTLSNVTEPPIPAIVVNPHADNGTSSDATAPSPKQPSAQAKVVGSSFLLDLAILLATLILL